MLRYDRLFEILVVIAFWGLLAAALYMLITFYVCDHQTCKPFVQAGSAGPPGSQAYILSLLNEFGSDGMWPFPYIGAAILTPLSLWFVQIPITLKNFAIVFFTSFVIIYFMFAFFNHHYIRFISDYTEDYIRTSCPSTTAANIGPIYDEEEVIDPVLDIPMYAQDRSIPEDDDVGPPKSPREVKIPSFSDGLGITFATPVNIF